jgi:hypothetical protein
MKNLLDDHNEWDEENTRPKEGKQAFRLIVKNVHSDSIDLIMDTTSSVEAWKILSEEFAGSSIPTQRAVLKALLNYQVGKDLHDEVKKIKELKRLLISSLGNKDQISVDQLVAVCFLEALPDQYSGTKAILEDQPSLKLEEICTKIIRSPVGFRLESSANKVSIVKCNHKRYPADKCWTCHPELRPICEECKSKGLPKFYHQPGSKFCSNKAIEAYSSSLRPYKSSEFILDSGCTDHMIKDIHLLSNVKPCNLGITTASNQLIPASGTGELNMSSENCMVKFKRVVACDQLNHNLISISQLAARGHVVIFDKSGGYVIEDSNIKMLNDLKSRAFLQAKEENGLYNLRLNQSKVNHTRSSTAATRMIWHRRLGHLNFDSMNQMAKLVTGYVVGDDTEEDCVPCVVSKSKRRSYKRSSNRATRPGELVHFDIGVINDESFQGFKYYILFVDDFSRYSILYPLRKKSDAEEYIIAHLNGILNKFSVYPTTVRSDNALEFSTSSLETFLFKNGIVHQTSCSHTHEQVGVVERMNQTITNAARTMLEYSQFPIIYWDLAFQAAVYVRNLSPTEANQSFKTPFELWNSRIPDISHLKIFGEPAYVHIPKANRRKLDNKAEKWYFVGYGEDLGSKGYKLLDIETNRIHVSSDVTFLQNPVFPTFPSGSLENIGHRNFSTQPNVFPFENTDSPLYSSSSGGLSRSQTMEEITHNSENSEMDTATYDSNSRQAHSPVAFNELNQNAPISTRTRSRNPMNDHNIYEVLYPTIASTSGNNAPPLDQRDSLTVGRPTWHAERAGEPNTQCNSIELSNEEYIAINDKDDTICLNTVVTQIPDSLDQTELTCLRTSTISWKANGESEPTTLEQIKGSPDEHLWLEAIQKELQSMEKHQVWTKLESPPAKKPISSKWVFKIKRREDGSIAKYKARLCVRGFTQQDGIDYHETFSPVLKHTSLRILLSIAAKEDMEIEQSDVETAFLLSPLEEELYMTLPDGTAVKLNKSIYGLKQAPRVWNETIHNILVSLGLKATFEDPCVYSGSINGHRFYLGLYVDDLIMCCKHKSTIKYVKESLSNLFKITDIGPLKYCLGYEIDRNRPSRTLKMHQSAYIKQIIARANMSDCKSSTVPANPSLRLSKSMCPKDDEEKEFMSRVPYRQIVGSLLYLVSGTRPDLSFSVSQVCRFMHNPGKQHWEAVKQIIRYLKGTDTDGITLGGKSENLNGYVDSDHAGNIDNRRSTTGYIFILYDGPVSWNCKTQPTVALSSTEAEYMALSTAAQEAMWIDGILNSLGIRSSKSISLLCDNQGSIKLSKNPVNHARTKHIDVRHHFIREAVQSGKINLQYVDTKQNLADMFTKPLGNISLRGCVKNLS